MAVETAHLGFVDYLVFGTTLAISLGIGIFHSVARGKQNTAREYLVGNGQMGYVPVTISMMVSYISAVIFIGFPAEIYAFGSQYWLGIFGIALGAVLASWVFVPLFYPLNIISVNEYLERRFESRLIKYIASTFGITGMVFFTGNALFGPSTAIEAVSGFPAWASILIGSMVTIMYTSMGGIKAVIWTDVFLCIMMFIGMMAVLIWGLVAVGGFSQVFSLSNQWGRLDFFDFDPDPTKRINVYGAIFGNALTFMGVYGYLQMGVQRYCSLPTITQAKRCVLGSIPGTMFLTCLCCLAGLVLFAYYTALGCDPLRSGKINNPNQILPYFVVDVLKVPVLPGLFLASLSAASLSSSSSSLNAAAANAWEDILKFYFPDASNRKKSNIIKSIVIFFGIISTLVAFAIAAIGGTMVQIMATFTSVVGGPTAALYYIGAFIPWVNWIAATIGAGAGCLFGLWVSLGSLYLGNNWVVLPSTVVNCTTPSMIMDNITWSGGMENVMMTAVMLNSTCSIQTTTMPAQIAVTGIDKLYSLSFLWLREVVSAVTVVVALIVSFFTGFRKPSTIQAKYMHPLMSKFFDLIPSEDSSAEVAKSLMIDKINCDGECNAESHINVTSV